MLAIRDTYNEIMADLCLKGFSGLVQHVDHDYKNDSCVASTRKHQPPYGNTNTDLKTKNKNEMPASSILLSGGHSLHNNEEIDYDQEIIFILNKSPGLTATQIQKLLKNKHEVSESLRRLKQSKLIDYDQYFKFYPVQVVG